MITVICATNRPDNQTQKIALAYIDLLKKHGENVNYFSMEELPGNFIQAEMYGNRSENFRQLLDSKIVKAEKLVVVCPEYNGTFSGVFKVFLDGCPPEIFYNKKVALVGTSSGRAGNLRGMDHLTNIFNYLQVEVLPFKVPVSLIQNVVKNEGIDAEIILVLERQIDKFLKF